MEETPETCKTCKHFFRHYIRAGDCLYLPLDDGHCGNPRRRRRRGDAPACHCHAARPKSKGK